jgi:hypothetical protein
MKMKNAVQHVEVYFPVTLALQDETNSSQAAFMAIDVPWFQTVQYQNGISVPKNLLRHKIMFQKLVLAYGK